MFKIIAKAIASLFFFAAVAFFTYTSYVFAHIEPGTYFTDYIFTLCSNQFLLGSLVSILGFSFWALLLSMFGDIIDYRREKISECPFNVGDLVTINYGPVHYIIKDIDYRKRDATLNNDVTYPLSCITPKKDTAY